MEEVWGKYQENGFYDTRNQPPAKTGMSRSLRENNGPPSGSWQTNDDEKRERISGNLSGLIGSLQFQDPDRQPRRILPVVHTHAGNRHPFGHLGDRKQRIKPVERPADRYTDHRLIGL